MGVIDDLMTFESPLGEGKAAYERKPKFAKRTLLDKLRGKELIEIPLPPKFLVHKTRAGFYLVLMGVVGNGDGPTEGYDLSKIEKSRSSLSTYFNGFVSGSPTINFDNGFSAKYWKEIDRTFQISDASRRTPKSIVTYRYIVAKDSGDILSVEFLYVPSSSSSQGSSSRFSIFRNFIKEEPEVRFELSSTFSSDQEGLFSSNLPGEIWEGRPLNYEATLERFLGLVLKPELTDTDNNFLQRYEYLVFQ